MPTSAPQHIAQPVVMSLPDSSRPKLHIRGIPVHFPHAPYRPQVALMHGVVTAITTRSHALVESPTGTGKSLALLCSTLALQAHLQATATTVPTTPPTSPTTTSHTAHTAPQNCSAPQPGSASHRSHAQRPPPSTPSPAHQPRNVHIPYSNPVDSDEDDFQPTTVFRDVSWQNPISKQRKRPADEVPENAYMLHRLENPLDPPHCTTATTPNHSPPSSPTTAPVPILPPQPTCKRVPRIFYATRTHTQVAQVVDELRKTIYRPRMTILASRREYCIHDTVRSTAASRDDTCKQLVADAACAHFFESETLAASPQLTGQAWDIEELTNLGQSLTACPYFASHQLYQDAQLVLCPYSFLVDPIVREARGIDVAGDIVILDEAHNIENYAREAASFESDVADMRRVIDEVDTAILTCRVAKGGQKLVVAYRRLKTLFEAFLSLVDAVISGDDFVQRDNGETAIYEREDLLKLFDRVDVNMDEVKYWRGAYDFIVHFGDGNDAKRFKRVGADRPVIDGLSQKVAEAQSDPKQSTTEPCTATNGGDSTVASTSNTRQGCSSGYGPVDDGTAPGDLASATSNPAVHMRRRRRVGIRGRRKGRGRGRGRGAGADDLNDDTMDVETPWVSRCMTTSHKLLTTLTFLFDNPDDYVLVLDRRVVDFVTVVKLSLHCLNAAVCFRGISGRARTVIVASGTLSPMRSFVGELGTAFTVAKSLPHVIDVRRQLYIAVAGQGACGLRFEATFHGAARFEFQDALGEALLNYCGVIPGGVLVFFPSYRLMTLLRTRWQQAGIWQRLQDVKGVVESEPVQRGEEFDAIVSRYQTASREDRGALMLAVCRGKLSEGVDFRDETARAVILVGIPFPHKNNVVVEQKRRWNDRTRLEGGRKELQTGAEWYEMQAFRALNQALGRVVRHRFDYGAILLMDVRFRQERVLAQLPSWTQEAVRNTNATHKVIVEELDAFYKGVHGQLAELAEMRRQPTT